MVTLERPAVGVLCVVLIWVPVAGGTLGIWSPAIAELLTLLGVVLWILSMVQNGRVEWRRTALDLPLALLVLLVLVQLVLGNRPVARWALAPPSVRSDLPTPFLSLGTVSPERTLDALLTLLTFAGVYLLVVNLIRRRRELDRLVQTSLLVGGLLGFLGLLAHFAGPAWLTRWTQGPLTGRLAWTFVNPDHFGSWLGMLICLGVGYLGARARASGSMPGFAQLVRSRQGREQAIRRYLPAVAIVVMGLALLFTLSRGAVVSLLVGLAGLLTLVGVLGWARRIFVVTGLVLAATLAYAAWIGLSPLVQRIGQGHADYGSRWLVFLTSVPMLGAAPVLGVGLGAYPDLYPRYQPAALDPASVYMNAAHNDWLQVAIELGLVGTALGLWALWRVGRDLVGAHLLGWGACPVGGGPGQDARRSDPFSVGIALGALGGVLVLLAHSVVDFPARIRPNGVLAAALLGIAAVALHTRFVVEGDQLLCQVRQVALGRRWLRAPVVGLAVLAMALVMTFVILRPSVVATVVPGGSASLSQVEKGLVIDPANPRLLEIRARLWFGAAQRAWNSGVAEGGRILASWDERRQEALPLLERALADLRAALSRKPSDPAFHQQLARVHWAASGTDSTRKSEHLAAAVTHFQRAIFLAPEDPSRYRTLALFAARQGGGPLLEIGLEAARGAVARDRRLLPELIDGLLEAQLRDAQWLAIVPASALDRLQLGAALEARGLFGPVAQVYRGALELASAEEASLAHWLLANLLMRQGDHRGAAVELEMALRRDPTNPELHLARARALAALADPDALDAYRAAIVSAEALATDARIRGAGELLPFSVKAPEARTLIRERVRPSEGVARYYRGVAEYLTTQRQWAQALPAWDVVLQTTPGDPAIHFARGVAFDGLGARDQALEAYRQAVALDGGSVAFRLRLAERLWGAEQFVQAMNEWQNILAQRPGNIEARLALAAAYIKVGKPTEAAQEYSRILQMVPNQADAQRGLDRLGRRSTP